MASEKILAKKQEVIDEIKSTVKDASSVVIFTYTGLTDEDTKKLRRILRWLEHLQILRSMLTNI